VVRRPVALPGGSGAIPHRTAFGRVRALPDHRWLDRALRGRLWIWLLGCALLGVVAMQVSLLKLNSGIGRAVETTATLQRQNSALEASIARLSDTNRVQKGAEALGMITPAPGDVGYLAARRSDPARAAELMQPPSEEAAKLLANHGIVPGSLAAIDTAAATTTTAAAATDTAVAADAAATDTAVAADAAATDAAVAVDAGR